MSHSPITGESGFSNVSTDDGPTGRMIRRGSDWFAVCRKRENFASRLARSVEKSEKSSVSTGFFLKSQGVPG
jgi:hypothetical protein